MCEIVNSCTGGCFPRSFLRVQVTPLFKPDGLDATNLANYRQILNLNTISKTLERLALSRLRQHIMDSLIFNRCQSAYRRYHCNDIYGEIDEGFLLPETYLQPLILLHILCYSAALKTFLESAVRRYNGSGRISLIVHNSFDSNRLPPTPKTAHAVYRRDQFLVPYCLLHTLLQQPE